MADEDTPLPGDDELDNEPVETGEDTEAEDDAPLDEDEPADGEEPAADEDEPAEGEEPPARAARPARRENETVRRLRERAQRAERERDDARRSGPPVDHGAAARAYEQQQAQLLEQARLNGTESEYWHQRTLAETRATVAMQQNQSAEREDSRDFRLLCREDPSVAAVKDFVEQSIAQARSRGDYSLTREAVANYRLGQLMRERRAAGAGKQRQRTDAQRDRQRVAAPRTGSDVQRPGRRKPEAQWTAEDYEREAGNLPLIR